MTFPDIDPKYADLPWIAHNQPDVYESGDLPESDQVHIKKDQTETFDLKSEIEVTHITPEDAYKKFSDNYVDNADADFSDCFGNKGYSVYRCSYDVLPDKDKNSENLLQRYQRLQTEINSMNEEICKLDDQSKIDPDEPVKVPQLIEMVESLQSQLRTLQLENYVGSDAHIDIPSSETMLLRHIKDQISSFKNQRPQIEGSNDAVSSDHIVYELYHGLDKQKQIENEKVADLHRRIERLEALVGTPDPSRLSVLVADTSQMSLFDASNKIAARSALLRGDNLDQIETRLTSLYTKLQSISEKHDSIAEADVLKRISELYDLVKKWHGVSESLPLIVERMTALKELHNKAADFNNALVTLEKSQYEMDINLKSYKTMLDKVESHFKDVMSNIDTNATALEQKIKKN